MFFNVAVLDFRIDIDPEIMKRGSFTAIKPPTFSRREGGRHFPEYCFARYVYNIRYFITIT